MKAEEAALEGSADAYGVRKGFAGFSLLYALSFTSDSGVPARGVASMLIEVSALL